MADENERQFDFEGPDRAYIKYLECLIMNFLPRSHLSKSGPSDYSTGGPSTSRYQFVEWKPRVAHDTQLDKSSKWSRQLRKFMESLPTNANWLEAQIRAGIDTPSLNQNALTLMLGHAGVAIFHEGYQIASPSPTATRPDLVARGCQYGQFVSRCGRDRDFATRVAAFQDLVFCSYCVVMIGVGVPRKITNDTMREYTGDDKEDHTLERYRRGAVWVNRCMAGLLRNGWGHRSWELFLLEGQTSAQFSRFASNDANSYQKVVEHMGGATIPNCEPGWVPYCLPCIVHYLTGYTVRLKEICEFLGYNSVFSSVELISTYFQEFLISLFRNNSGQALTDRPHHAEPFTIHPLDPNDQDYWGSSSFLSTTR